MKVLTLLDNSKGEQKALKAEHGLSFYIETDSNIRILFDFGAGASAYENAVKMNVPLNRVDFAIGSHGHYDHAAGYPDFVKNGLKCKFITGEGFFNEKYAFDGNKATYLGTGFDKSFLLEHEIEYDICSDVFEFSKDCYVIGRFPRTHEMEQIPERFVLRMENAWKQDSFDDEICLAIEQEDGIVVIAGCSHPGILNILERVHKHFNKPLKAVIGGTHLVEAEEERVRKTIEEIKKMGVRAIGFNHCSGIRILDELREENDLKTFYLGSGDCIFF